MTNDVGHHGAAEALAAWVTELRPSAEDLRLAHRCLVDTVACALAVPPGEPIVRLAGTLTFGGGAAVLMHYLDFDDLHMESTTHISTVCVPATLAVGGDADDFLAGAGTMARLGNALGWSHYGAGWHATTTTGALASAAVAAHAYGLDAERTAAALALAVPASGGVQRAFGTDAKSLQVGFAVEAGLRAARLARAGAGADPSAVDQWMKLLSPSAPPIAHLGTDDPTLPGGLAIKLSPCCYALQRPIAAVQEAAEGFDGADRLDRLRRITVTTLDGTLHPLIHHDPRTGLEGKFSLEYAVAAALLDEHVGFASFTDAAVTRPAARDLVAKVHVEARPGGTDLLEGTTAVVLEGDDGVLGRADVSLPPGAPGRPPTAEQLDAKVRDCQAHGRTTGSGVDTGIDAENLTWARAADIISRRVTARTPESPASPNSSTEGEAS